MFQVIQRLRLEFADSIIVYRLLGTSPHSVNAFSLIKSIWKQCKRIAGEDESQPPKDWDAASMWMKQFKWSGSKIILVLDSIDQLTNQDRALNGLANWIPGLTSALEENVRVVLSTLPSDKGIDLVSQFHKCGVNIVTALPFDTSDRPAVVEGLKIMTDNRPSTGTIMPLHRVLSPKTEEIMVNITKVDSSPLFISILLDTVCAWPSYCDIDTNGKELMEVAETKGQVKGLIDLMFGQLEQKHGKKLVSALLGIITLAREGVSENEAEDIISTMDEVLSDIFEWWTPPVRRIPPMLVHRILVDLGKFMVKRNTEGGLSAYVWYHRQFW